jgi:hypothetical protein
MTSGRTAHVADSGPFCKQAAQRTRTISLVLWQSTFALGVPGSDGRGVGGHRLGNGRFCCRFAGSPRPPHPDPGGLQITTDRFAATAGRLLEAPQRPAQSRQRHDRRRLSSPKTLLMPA